MKQGSAELRAFGLIVLAFFVSTCLVVTCNLPSKSIPEVHYTERDWINGQFGDPLKPLIYKNDGYFGVDDIGPSMVVAVNFMPKVGPQLFISGLYVDMEKPDDEFLSDRIKGSLSESRLSQYGRMIGKNSCGQNLFLVTQFEKFNREVSFRSSPQSERLEILIFPDTDTIIDCLNPIGSGGCRTYFRYKKVQMMLVIPSENVCSWPTIRQQLMTAVDDGLVPQALRTKESGDQKNAR